VAGRPSLVQFCSIGSLTGRWGGMTGETDYAAANEALARLGLWARRHLLSCSVKTLVWPTWESVGMITNFAVTKRYVTPMSADEGVRHWLRELVDCSSGEIMFMGAVGRALTPIQIKGFSPIFDLRNISQLVTLHHHAGEPRQFRPAARFLTHYRIEPANAPFVRAFRLDGRPALPASMLLEHACGVGAWVSPEDFRPRALAALANVVIRLDQLVWKASADGAIHLESAAMGSWRGDDWQVEVCCRHVVSQSEVLRLTLVYSDRAVGRMDPQSATRPSSGQLVRESLPSPQRATWVDHLLPAAEWQTPRGDWGRTDAALKRTGWAPPASAADLWATPLPPELRLPVNHLENVLQALWSAQAGPGESAVHHWRIGCLVIGPAPAAQAHHLTQYADGRFNVTDGEGQSVLELRGTTLEVGGDQSAVACSTPELSSLLTRSA